MRQPRTRGTGHLPPHPAVPAAAVAAALCCLAAAAPPGHPPGAAGCVRGEGREFPVAARILGGPAAYRPGGAPQEWTVELSGRARGTCRALYPVLVLVDADRKVQPAQVRLEFDRGSRWHPVHPHGTDRHETVAVLGETPDFPGFTVAPGRTVRVRVRLTLTPGAGPDHVRATVAVVRRTGGGRDGEWVGESAPYTFEVAPDADGAAPPAAEAHPVPPESARPEQPLPRGELPAELAGTGGGRGLTGARLAGFAAVAGLLVAAGASLLLLARRLRRPYP
ncbi:hypothetical protein [Streptomyces sp. NPDC058045]|uniref:hypothetical protein n=1 Tax=Streptomyces sp. NPDC058045 TaxID=3346311 RepID=UPI0036E5CD8D